MEIFTLASSSTWVKSVLVISPGCSPAPSSWRCRLSASAFASIRRAPSRASSVKGSAIDSDWRKGRIVVSFFIGVLLLVRFWLALTQPRYRPRGTKPHARQAEHPRPHRAQGHRPAVSCPSQTAEPASCDQKRSKIEVPLNSLWPVMLIASLCCRSHIEESVRTGRSHRPKDGAVGPIRSCFAAQSTHTHSSELTTKIEAGADRRMIWGKEKTTFSSRARPLEGVDQYVFNFSGCK